MPALHDTMLIRKVRLAGITASDYMTESSSKKARPAGEFDDFLKEGKGEE